MRITKNLQENFPFISVVNYVEVEYVGIIIIAQEIKKFNYVIKNFATKDVNVLFGPVTSLNDIIVKRIKRKSITLIKKP